MNDLKALLGKIALPDFRNLQFDSCENSPGLVPLTVLAQYLALDDQFGSVGHGFDFNRHHHDGIKAAKPEEACNPYAQKENFFHLKPKNSVSAAMNQKFSDAEGAQASVMPKRANSSH